MIINVAPPPRGFIVKVPAREKALFGMLNKESAVHTNLLNKDLNKCGFLWSPSLYRRSALIWKD
uniref:Transposase n=1 Tax=Heterorhabditis bacteriophora TaxID=37862 RepID=A0A1I7XGE1_HETBA